MLFWWYKKILKPNWDMGKSFPFHMWLFYCLATHLCLNFGWFCSQCIFDFDLSLKIIIRSFWDQTCYYLTNCIHFWFICLEIFTYYLDGCMLMLIYICHVFVLIIWWIYFWYCLAADLPACQPAFSGNRFWGSKCILFGANTDLLSLFKWICPLKNMRLLQILNT